MLVIPSGYIASPTTPFRYSGAAKMKSEACKVIPRSGLWRLHFIKQMHRRYEVYNSFANKREPSAR